MAARRPGPQSSARRPGQRSTTGPPRDVESRASLCSLLGHPPFAQPNARPPLYFHMWWQNCLVHQAGCFRREDTSWAGQVEYLDRSPGAINHHEFLPNAAMQVDLRKHAACGSHACAPPAHRTVWPGQHTAVPVRVEQRLAVQATLLYRPGHYDLLSQDS